MKVWALMENTACREGLACEHGLSLYIEAGEHRILFDAGQSGAFAENAEKLGVDLGKVDFAVLSHGHYDHGGGLGEFLRRNREARIYVNQFAFGDHRHGVERYIGLEPGLRECGRVELVDGVRVIAPGVTILPAAVGPYPVDCGGLVRMENGVLLPEDFRHEQYLLIEENGKRVLFSGCSHRGILNIMSSVRPDVLVGGFHFMNVEDPAVLARAAEILMGYPTMYYTGHCTGMAQFEVLKGIMGERLEYLSAGGVISI